ncbi:hypothetical protein Q7C_2570 [Methylophaga frappieri]|uniref:Uncharacterized protein n=1 Tax=Methylophaga frappieri (strain ATCC BAA-2434 / DSM 25690 / JAM7) TaxID=754477 RepID=I1YL98_METFJ|nr:hypothetical protein [Methylophaga frappieri]AFJ03691.1 hypothetical protein Q7C_2570 [Methylophaga frappieri]
MANHQLETSIVVLARQRLKALKVALAGREADLNQVQNVFHQLTGLTSLRFVENHGLSDATVDELILLDNLAILNVQYAHPEAIEKFSTESQELSRYLDMPAKALLDLIFKEGARFSNPEAVSVALHRGLISDLHHESAAYARLAEQEQRRKLRLAKEGDKQ